jgi:DTW domain
MENPKIFERLFLDSFESLETAERLKCPNCDSYRKYYCYDCCVPLVPNFPRISLPIQATILKCKKEPRSKSSVMVLKVVCPETSDVAGCLGEDDSIPVFPQGSVLVFPGNHSKTLSEFSDSDLESINKFIFIDSTWHQTTSMMKNKNLAALPMLRLENHTTAFWRYQNESKNSLATIEAVYYTYVDYHKEMKNRGLYQDDYQGQYDNLLWYFVFNYNVIQTEYTQKRHKGKRFKKMPDYIKK